MLISMLTIVCFGDLWISKVSISFAFQYYLQLDLKIKLKHRYSYTDSAVMG